MLLHPILGSLVFFAIMYTFFQAIFTWAAPLQDAVEGGFSALGQLVHGWLDDSHPLLAGLLGDGLIGGVGSVLTFVPQIIIMFLIIAFLEGVGYMSRAAFLMDRIMSRAGLEGGPSWPCCRPSPARSRGSWLPARYPAPRTGWPRCWPPLS